MNDAVKDWISGKGDMPLVVQELINFRIFEETTQFLLICVISILAASYVPRAMKWAVENEFREHVNAIASLCGVLALTLAYSAACDVIEVLAAPRVAVVRILGG